MKDAKTTPPSLGNKEIAGAIEVIFSAVKSQDESTVERSVVQLVKICHRQGMEAEDTLSILRSQGFKMGASLDRLVHTAHQISKNKQNQQA